MKIFDPKLTGSIEIQSQVSGSIIPTTNETFDLGSASNRWNDIYLAGSTIDLGGTKMTKDSSGNIEFKDASNNRKKIIVEEILIGTGDNQKTLKVDNGKSMVVDKDGNVITQMAGHIMPHGHDIYDLGSPTAQWRDLYLSSGSLYIDGTQVISSTSNVLTVTTSTGQSLKLLETGADDITIQTDSGNIELKGTVEILSGKKLIDSAGTIIQFGDSLGVTGSIEVSGTVDGIDLQSMSSSLDSRISTLTGKTIISSSAQIASEISGSNTAFSASVSTRFEGLTTDYTELDNIPNNIISSSAQIASDISGSNTAFSASVATRFEGLTTDYTELDNIPNNIVSSSAQVTALGALMDSEVTSLSLVKSLTAAKISGSFTSASNATNTKVDSNTSNITSLNASTSSYLQNTTDTLTGNLTVTGTLTAQQFNTEIVSASILFDSGSTKFGDSSDDLHQFTGSLKVLGNITATGYNNANWDTAYGWGDHSTEGYLTGTVNRVIGTDTDLNFSGANVLSTIALTDGVITAYTNRVLTLANLGYTGASNANNYVLPFTDNSANWNTAFGWGNHGLSAQDKIDISNLSGTNTGDQDLSSFLTSAAASNTYLPLAGGTMAGSIDLVNNRDISMTDNAGAVTRVMVLNTSNTMYIGPVDTYAGGSILYGVAAGVSYQRFYTGASERMRIGSNGNMGIGTTGTTYRLQVENNTAGNLLSRFHNTNANGQGLLIRAGNTSAANRVLQIASENDTKIMTVNSNGRVGIGTTNPTTTLQLQGDGTYISVKAGDGSNGVQLGTDSSGDGLLQLYSDSGANNIKLYGEAASPSFINAGNVGIGDTTPLSKFEVAGTIKSTNYDSAHTSESGVTLGYNASEAMAYLETWTSKPLTFRTYNYQSFNISGTEAMRIATNRNVGIGTTSPGVKLEIGAANDGDVVARLTQTYEKVRLHNFDLLGYGDGHLWMIGNNNNTSIVLGASWDWDKQVEFNYDPGTTGLGAGLLTIGQTNKNNTNFTHGVTRFYTNGSERMRINSSGNVGIGTTAPTYRLVVNKTSVAAPALMIGGAYYGGPRIQTYGLDADANAWMGLGTDMGVGSYEHSVYYPNHANGKLTFGTYNGTTYSTKTTLLQNGKFGIGTTVPSQLLDVNGTILATRFVQNTTLANSNTWAEVILDSAGSSDDTNLVFAKAGSMVWDIYNHASTDKLQINTKKSGGAGVVAEFQQDGKVAFNGYSGGGWLKSNGSFRIDMDANNDSTDRAFIVSKNNAGGDLFKVLETGEVGIGRTPDSRNALDIEYNTTSGAFQTNRNYSGFFLNRTYADYNNDGTIIEYQERIGVDGNKGSVGMYSSHAFAIRTNNIDRIYIRNGGNVGIGTSLAAEKLEVIGGIQLTDDLKATGNNLKLFAGGNQILNLDLNGKVYPAAHNSMDLGFSATNAWRNIYTGNLYANSYVGIGTTSPSSALHVKGANTVAKLESSTGYVDMIMVNSGNTGFLNLDTSKMNFYVGGGSASNLKMSITNAGNVGIGDTGPSTKLQVSTDSPANNVAVQIGDGWVGNSAYHKAGGLLLISGTSQNSTQTGAGIAFQTRNTANTNYWKSSIIMDRDGAMKFTLGGAGTVAGSEDITILSGGNVGIGTTSPVQKLQVNGSVYSNGGEFFVNTNSGITAVGNLLFKGHDGSSYFEGMRLESTGNVGIGTTSPTLGKLQVAGRGYFGPVGTGNATTKAEVISNAVLRLKPHDNNSTSLSFASMNNGDTIGLQTTNGPGTANWNVALSPFGGRVGIGTSGPSALLDIGGGDGTPNGTQFQAVIKATGARTLYLDAGDSSAASMWWGKGNTPQFALDSLSGGGAGFWTYTGSWNQRMTILSGGNVGIGSTSPGYKLDIKNTSSEDSNMALRNSGSGHAGIYFDGSNGDLVGSDYAWIGQRNSTLKFEINTAASGGNIHLIPQSGNGVVEVSGKVVANNHGEFAGALRVTETGTAQHILIGNQDSAGANKPGMIQGVNGQLKFGYGSSWSSEGGTMTDTLVLDASNLATFANRVTLGPGTTGTPYDATTFLHVKGTTRSIVQQSSTADAYYMFGDAAANNAAWVGYNHSSGNLDLHAQTSVSIDKNTSITGDLTVSGTLTAQEFRTELTTTTILYDSGSTKFGDTSDDNHDFTGSLNVQGNVEHTGLTMTSGTDIDQLYTTTKSMTLTTNWQDTGINGTDLTTGTYVVAVYAHDHAVGGSHYYETYSGTMTWYQNDTNSTTSDEIILHKAGHHSTQNIYLRTKRTATADTDDLKLQIAHSATCTGNSDYVFKFRRLI